MLQSSQTEVNARETQLPLSFEATPAHREVRPAIGRAPERPRRKSHCDEILRILRCGPATNAELVEVCLAYRARISNLRACGHNIVCRRVPGQRDTGLRVYTLEVAIDE